MASLSDILDPGANMLFVFTLQVYSEDTVMKQHYIKMFRVKMLEW